ncbi:MAG TPA: PAS domain-containing protein [Xanthobacteraceae bacterium]|nr:PAS domain-containing protein [Xanthobacteraceae bacterium]
MGKLVKVQSAPGVLLRAAVGKFACLPTAWHAVNWTITSRLIAIVIALALPLNLVIVAVIWNLDRAADEAQRTNLLYAARSLAAAVDAELDKCITLAQALSRSPALLDDNLDAFDAEARRTFASMKDASFLVAARDGQQLINGAALQDRPLPRLQPAAMRAHNLAFESRSVVVSGVLIGNVSKEWVADIYVPVFKNNQPFRTLAVAMRARGFLKLLDAHELPPNWQAGIIDGQGRFIARLPDHAAFVGELASQEWRDVKDQDGIFEFLHAGDGDVVLNASAHPALSSWTVGVAVKKSELQAAVLNAVGWAIVLGIAISLMSLGLAVAVARRITRPIEEMRGKAAMVLSGRQISFEPRLPELAALWSALQQAVADRSRSDAAQRESEGRLAAVVTSSQAAIVTTTLDGAITSWNAAAERLFGYTAKEMVGQSIRRLLPAKRQSDEAAMLARVAAGETTAQFEATRLHKNGSTVQVSVTISPIHDRDGKVVGLSGIARDIGARKQAEESLRDRLSEIEAIYDNMPIGLALLDRDLRYVRINAALAEMNGVPAADHIGRLVWDIVPAMRETCEPLMRRVLETGEIARIEVSGESSKLPGISRHWDKSIYPLRRPDGSILAIGVTVEEITERKRAEELQSLLMREINHRTKNMLSVVQSIARQTAASDTAEFIRRFSARIQALSANQDLLIKSDWRGVELEDLVRAQLGPFADLVGMRITVHGPKVRLAAAAAQSIGMALHELATNAGKYGALSAERGCVDIDWRLDGNEFSIGWAECDGPAVVPPKRHGFGSTVISTVIKASVDGEVELNYAQTGLTWRLKCSPDKILERRSA